MAEFEFGLPIPTPHVDPTGDFCADLSCVVELSGIYYINPTKTPKHDSYNDGSENKIPDPTIRTAFIGE